MKYGIDTRCQHLADDNKDEIYGDDQLSNLSVCNICKRQSRRRKWL